MELLEDKSKDWRQEIECGSCGSRISIDKEDPVYVSYNYSDSDSNYSLGITCPACNTYYSLKDAIPSWVRCLAIDRYRKKAKEEKSVW